MAAVEADGLGGVADEVDDDALDDLGGEAEGRQRWRGGYGDLGCAGGDALEDGREVAHHGGVVAGGGDGVGGAGVAAAKESWGKFGGVDAGRGVEGGGDGQGEEALDELGAAVGDDAEFCGVVLMLGAQDAGQAEEIAVEAEGGEEIAGVVGQAGGVGEVGGERMEAGSGRRGGRLGGSGQRR